MKHDMNEWWYVLPNGAQIPPHSAATIENSKNGTLFFRQYKFINYGELCKRKSSPITFFEFSIGSAIGKGGMALFI